MLEPCWFHPSALSPAYQSSAAVHLSLIHILKISALLSQHGVIFALLAGVILAGILASTMSTSDSQLLAASSAVSSDILGAFRKDS